VPLVVDPWTGGFDLSGLALSRETHPATDLGLGLGLGLEGRTPLVADGLQMVPTGATVFTKSEPPFFYFEVYGSGATTARVRVLDARTGDQKWDGGFITLPAQSNGKTSISAGSRLPVDSLAPGAYQLEVTAADAAGKQLKRTAGFEIASR
jgi:hypothetical protein